MYVCVYVCSLPGGACNLTSVRVKNRPGLSILSQCVLFSLSVYDLQVRTLLSRCYPQEYVQVCENVRVCQFRVGVCYFT